MRQLFVLAFVLVLVLGAAAVVLDLRLRRSDVLEEYPGRPQAAGGVNWLIVGSDSRAGLSEQQQERLVTGGDAGPPRSDTVLVAHIAGSGPAVVVSLPRDSSVLIPGEEGRNKLNTAYARGGGQLLAKTVELATGLRINHYAEIGFGGLADLVDAVDGVDVCLDAPLSDPLAGIDLPKGCQRLRGAEALGLSRSRATPRADLDRMLHQRVLVEAIVAKLGSRQLLSDPSGVPVLWRFLTEDVAFDREAHVWQLEELVRALGGEVTATVVPISGFADTDSGNVVLWDKDKAKELFGSLR